MVDHRLHLILVLVSDVLGPLVVITDDIQAATAGLPRLLQHLNSEARQDADWLPFSLRGSFG